MESKEILEKAIRRATDNGYKHGIQWMHQVVNDYAEDYNYSGLIFSHEFATCLWGDKEVHYYDIVDLDNGGKTETVTMPIWHYHLKQMVVAEDPTQYLGENT